MLVGQPTRGVDIGTIEASTPSCCACATKAWRSCWSSVELEEVRALADRILVMSGGRITGELPDRRIRHHPHRPADGRHAQVMT
jgi:ABC-type sugar transport system ATPase subunit